MKRDLNDGREEQLAKVEDLNFKLGPMTTLKGIHAPDGNMGIACKIIY